MPESPAAERRTEAPSKGSLFLVPNLAAEGIPPEACLPAAAIATISRLRHFVVEGEKAAWRLLSRLLDRAAAAAVVMERLDEHTRTDELPRLLEPLARGEDVGLVSEAGMPCVADPGGALVALAHAGGYRVVPLVGPSAILLALAASGLDGQRFSFLGYLPQEPGARRRALLELERGVERDGATRIFIETPYRNERMIDECLSCLGPGTRLCVASGILTPEERIRQDSVADWRAARDPVGKVPAVFLLGKVPGTGLDRPGSIVHSGGTPCQNRKR